MSVVVVEVKGTECVVKLKLAIDLLAKRAAAGPPSSLRVSAALHGMRYLLAHRAEEENDAAEEKEEVQERRDTATAKASIAAAAARKRGAALALLILVLVSAATSEEFWLRTV